MKHIKYLSRLYCFAIDQSSDYNEIKKTKIPLTPLPEQTAIANYLDAKTEQINRFIEKMEKQIALLKDKKRSLTTEIIKEEAKNIEKIKLKYCVRNVSVQTSQMHQWCSQTSIIHFLN